MMNHFSVIEVFTPLPVDIISPYETDALFPLVEKAISPHFKKHPQKWKTTFEMRKNTFEIIQIISNIILAFAEH